MLGSISSTPHPGAVHGPAAAAVAGASPQQSGFVADLWVKYVKIIVKSMVYGNLWRLNLWFNLILVSNMSVKMAEKFWTMFFFKKIHLESGGRLSVDSGWF